MFYVNDDAVLHTGTFRTRKVKIGKLAVSRVEEVV